MIMLSPTMFRDNQNPNEPNLPFAQGFSTAEKNYVLMSLGKLNQNVGTNSRNLVQMGKDMTKIGQDNIWFGKKIRELENNKILDFKNCPIKVEPIPNKTKTKLKPKKKLNVIPLIFFLDEPNA